MHNKSKDQTQSPNNSMGGPLNNELITTDPSPYSGQLPMLSKGKGGRYILLAPNHRPRLC